MRSNCGYEVEYEYAENKGHRKGKGKRKAKASKSTTAWRPEWTRKSGKAKKATASRKSPRREKIASWSKKGKKPARKASCAAKSSVPMAALLKQIDQARRILNLALGQLAKRKGC